MVLLNPHALHNVKEHVLYTGSCFFFPANAGHYVPPVLFAVMCGPVGQSFTFLAQTLTRMFVQMKSTE
jgi:hypothetical protein